MVSSVSLLLSFPPPPPKTRLTLPIRYVRSSHPHVTVFRVGQDAAWDVVSACKEAREWAIERIKNRQTK